MFGTDKKDTNDIEIMGTFDDIDLDDIDDSYLDEDSNEKEKIGLDRNKIIQILLALAAVLFVIIFLFNQNEPQQVDDNIESSTAESTQEEVISSGEVNNNPSTDAKENYDGIVVREENGMTYSGNEKGSPINGTGAILLFDYHYYNDKDADKVLDNYNPEVRDLFSREFIQSKINEPPEGTQYSLDITPVTVGEEYDVILKLNIPGAEPVSYRQKITTVKKDDRFYVENIESTEIKENDSSE